MVDCDPACRDSVADGDSRKQTSGSRERGRDLQSGGRVPAGMVLLLSCTLSCQLAGAAAWTAKGAPIAGAAAASSVAAGPAVRAALLSVALLSQLPVSSAWNHSGEGVIQPSSCDDSCAPALGTPSFTTCNTTCYVSMLSQLATPCMACVAIHMAYVQRRCSP